MKIAKIADAAVLNAATFTPKSMPSVIQYLDTGNITNGVINCLQSIKTTNEPVPSRAQRKVKKDTIVYSMVRPRLRHWGILQSPNNNMVVSTGFVTIDAKSGMVDPYYLYYWLTTTTITSYLANLADTAASSYPSITPSNIGNLKITIPDRIDDQKKIANVIRSIDSKASLNRMISSQLGSLIKTIYNYWFLQFEFPDENGRPYRLSGGKMIYNDALKREIPAGWRAEAIGSVLVENEKSNVQVKKAKTGGGMYPFFTSGESVLSADKCIVNGENIFLNTGGNADVKFYVGKASYSTDTWCVTANNENMSEYLYLYLKSFGASLDRKFFWGSGLKHLQKPLLKSEPICVPPNEILTMFHQLVYPMFDMISRNTIENRQLASLRDFLLPLLMNGQVSIDGARADR